MSVSPDYVIRCDSVVTALEMRGGNQLVCGTEEGQVVVYDTEIMRPRASWTAHKGWVTKCTIVPVSHTLLQHTLTVSGFSPFSIAS